MIIEKKKLCKWKLIGRKRIVRPNMRWEDDLVNDLKQVKLTNLRVVEGRRA